VITFPVAIAVGKNLDFNLFGIAIQGEEFPYQDIIFISSAALIFLLGALRSSKKWIGMNVVKQVNRFKFSTPISEGRKSRVLLYNVLEILFFLSFAAGLFYFSMSTKYIVLVFVLLSLDSIINTILGINARRYRVGITKNAVVMADRETKAIYFTGLKRISRHQQTLYFEYTNGLVLHFPTNLIPDDEWENFAITLREQVSDEKVYYTGF
jgi:hypothetical protein